MSAWGEWDQNLLFKYKNIHSEAVQLSVMYDEMLEEVYELWQGTDSRFGLSSLCDYYVQLDGFSMTELFVRQIGDFDEFRDKNFAMEWAKLLDKYMEIFHYLMRYKNIQISPSLPSQQTLDLLRLLDHENEIFLRNLDVYLSNLPPRVTEYIQFELMRGGGQRARSMFGRFGIYLREINDFIDQTPDDREKENLEYILHEVKGIMREFFLLFLDALWALEKFRRDLQDVQRVVTRRR